MVEYAEITMKFAALSLEDKDEPMPTLALAEIKAKPVVHIPHFCKRITKINKYYRKTGRIVNPSKKSPKSEHHHQHQHQHQHLSLTKTRSPKPRNKLHTTFFTKVFEFATQFNTFSPETRINKYNELLEMQQNFDPASHLELLRSLTVGEKLEMMRTASRNAAREAKARAALAAAPVLPAIAAASDVESRTAKKEVKMEEEEEEISVGELASYFEESLRLPKKMSVMAEAMYT